MVAMVSLPSAEVLLPKAVAVAAVAVVHTVSTPLRSLVLIRTLVAWVVVAAAALAQAVQVAAVKVALVPSPQRALLRI